MEAPPQTVQTLCRMCDDRCGIDVRVEDGCVLDVSGNAAHPWNHGRLCVKARAAVDTVNHPDRLLRPLKRRGEDWEELSLEQALDEIAERLQAIIAGAGARSVSVWKGEAIGFAQQEDLARRFIHAIGSPNYLSNDSMCWVGRFAGYKLVLGAWPNVDIENARCVVMWGANPPHSRPNLTQRVTAARRRGATLVAVDPRLSAVARRADLHVAPLPGTDGALALGLIRELVETGSYDRAFIEDYLSSNADSYNHPNAANEPRIPGIFQYYSAAEQELVNGLGSGASAQEIGDAIYAAWEGITDQIGRESQIELYRASLGL